MALTHSLFLYLIMISISVVHLLVVDQCSHINKMDDNCLRDLGKAVIPELEGKTKGDSGKIAVIGGSAEYTGAPYFSAITALKIGADLVYVITTESAAPIIKSYSPDLIVIPYNILKINITNILSRVDIVVLGPGFGREREGINLAYEVISICNKLKKPLVIDADGLYAISKNVNILKDFPHPGAILTPNFKEAKLLRDAVSNSTHTWKTYWGKYVSVLEKGANDKFSSGANHFNWSVKEGGSPRRAGGQGDILSGALAIFLDWALRANLCEISESPLLAQSVASYAASIFTRRCSAEAFKLYNRNMLASDMISQIHVAFNELYL